MMHMYISIGYIRRDLRVTVVKVAFPFPGTGDAK